MTHPSHYVVIGDFERHSEAVGEGVRRFGRGPFLIRRTGDKQRKFFARAVPLGQLP